MAYKRISPITVSEGGTGAQTLTGVVTGNGTSALTANTVTQHGVLIGGASNAVSSLGVATNGQLLVGATSANPSFVTPTAGTGLSVTTNSTTLSYALSTPVSIANGGTNATSMATTDGVVYFDGTRLVTTSAGTSGQVLTSNGAGVAPTYQAASGGVNTFHTDSGDATGSGGAITIAGTSNQITTAGASATVTVALASSPTVSGTFTSTAGGFTMPLTSSSSNGVFTIDSHRFMHVYGLSTDNNVFLGRDAGNFTLTTGTALNNICIGYQAGSALTTGNQNVIIATGQNSLSTGASNVLINGGGVSITSASRNIAINGGTSLSSGATDNVYLNATGASENNTLRIGDGTGTGSKQLNVAVICGIFGKNATSGSAVFVTSTNVLGTVTSSERFKEQIKDIGNDSENLYKLRPVSFKYKEDDAIEKGAKNLKHYGLIAEEVLPYYPELITYNEEGEIVSVRYHMLYGLMLNEIQKLNKRIEVLEEKLKGE